MMHIKLISIFNFIAEINKKSCFWGWGVGGGRISSFFSIILKQMEHIYFVELFLQGHLLDVDMEYVHITSSAWDVNRCLIIKIIKTIFCRSSNKESLLGMITSQNVLGQFIFSSFNFNNQNICP
jgi:hypothetical protein